MTGDLIKAKVISAKVLTPTTSNRSGAIFTGTSSDCDAACRAFAQAVINCVNKQIDL